MLTPSARDDLLALLTSSERALGTVELAPAVQRGGDAQLLSLVDDVLVRLLARAHDMMGLGEDATAPVQELCALAIAVQELRVGLHAEGSDLGETEQHSIGEALSRLRMVEPLEQLLARGPEELCVRGGFDRAAVLRVTANGLEPIAAHFIDEPEWAERFCAFLLEHPIPLTSGIVEGEVLRRRQPMLVSVHDRHIQTFQPMVDFLRTTSYVVAPVVLRGRPVGTLIADTYSSGREVTPEDLDRLWAFCEGFSYALERSALYERIRWQQDELRHVLDATDLSITRWSDESPGAEDPPPRPASPMLVPRPPAHHGLEALTKREFEVLQLVVGGASNDQIAEQLFISYGTAKAHVKHILRKLGATNRTEAISLYFAAMRAEE